MHGELSQNRYFPTTCGILFVDAISTGIASRDSDSEKRCREMQGAANDAVEASSKYYINW